MADKRTVQSVRDMSREDLAACVRALARDDLNVVFEKFHALQRMSERRITRQEVLATLRNGTINTPPRPGDYVDEVTCRMEHPVDGREIAAVVAISNSEDDLIVITVIDIT